MSGYPTLTAETLDTKKITITEPKKKNDKIVSYIQHDKSLFFLQTEDGGRTPFGVNSFAGEKSGENNDYSGDFSTHCGLIYQKDAAGVVEAIGPQVQVTSGDVSVLYQGDVIVGRLAMGCGTLNPAAAIELQSARS